MLNRSLICHVADCLSMGWHHLLFYLLHCITFRPLPFHYICIHLYVNINCTWGNMLSLPPSSNRRGLVCAARLSIARCPLRRRYALGALGQGSNLPNWIDYHGMAERSLSMQFRIDVCRRSSTTNAPCVYTNGSLLSSKHFVCFGCFFTLTAYQRKICHVPFINVLLTLGIHTNVILTLNISHLQ